MRKLLVATLSALVCACGSEPNKITLTSPDAYVFPDGSTDAGQDASQDASTPDSGQDSGLPDSGVPDSGVPDAGKPDSGTPDSGIPDAGAPDAGSDGGTPDGGGQDGGTPVISASVSVSFPNLFSEGGQQILPTYISHVIGSSQYPLSAITVQNTGNVSADFLVTIDLPYYGAASSVTTSVLAPGGSQTVHPTPALYYASLFGLTTAVAAQLQVSVGHGAVPVFAETYPIQISGRDTVFWGSAVMNDLISVMVTPNDAQGRVTGLVTSSESLAPEGILVGYQTGLTWPQASYTVNVGQYVEEVMYLFPGEAPTTTIDSVVDYNTHNPVTSFTVEIFDDASFQDWVAGTHNNYCAKNSTPHAGDVVSCAAVTTAGYYHIVYATPANLSSMRIVTRERPMSKWESTVKQSEAIFLELRAMGLTYANLPGTGYFANSQNVMYPSEALEHQSANCIEGSLVMSSAWERLGMHPVIALDLAHGHAFTAVQCWSDTPSCVVAVETTMIGGSATFVDAVNTAAANWAAWGPSPGDGSLLIIDIPAMRAVGLTPAPM